MSSSSTNVFELGKYAVVLVEVNTKGSCGSGAAPSPSIPPSKPLLIARPSEEGEYPLYWITGPNLNDETKSAAAITDWLSEGLQSVLPPLIRPNLSKVSLTGHSRGGKTAFVLALGIVMKTSLKFSALMGIDPVDGTSKGHQTTPKVLTYVPCSFDLNMPVMVIGSGLGEKWNFVLPPCAPKDVNHKDFYDECGSPACYFVVKDYGHNDMLDDETGGIRGIATYGLCKSGKSRKPMRTFVGGTMVAFMKACLEGDHDDLNAIKNGQEPLPVELQTVGSK